MEKLTTKLFAPSRKFLYNNILLINNSYMYIFQDGQIKTLKNDVKEKVITVLLLKTQPQKIILCGLPEQNENLLGHSD